VAAKLPSGRVMRSLWRDRGEPAMSILKNLVVAVLLIGSLLLGIFVATATA